MKVCLFCSISKNRCCNFCAFSIIAKLQGRDVSLFQNEFLKFILSLQIDFSSNSSKCTISRVNLSKLVNFPLGCHNKKSILPCILAPFWWKVTYSPDSPANVLIESRGIHQIGTVPSNRIYKMHEITFIYITSTHCRKQMASNYTAF